MGLAVVALLLPLSMDTLAVSAAIGVAGLSDRERLRLSLVISLFEGGMPLVGAIAGGLLGRGLGRVAGLVAVILLAATGGLMLREGGGGEGGDDEDGRGLGERTKGWAMLGLGLSVSLDELAIGVGIGLLGLSLPIAVVLIAIQAFAAVQVGSRLGARVGAQLRETGERAAGVTLICLAVLFGLLTATGRL